MTVTIDEEVKTRFQAVAAPNEDFSAFLAAAVKDAIIRRERQAAARAEAQAILNGPRQPSDSEATYRKYQEKHGLPDLAHLSGEPLLDDTERLIAAMPPEKRAALEREGWL